LEIIDAAGHVKGKRDGKWFDLSPAEETGLGLLVSPVVAFSAQGHRPPILGPHGASGHLAKLVAPRFQMVRVGVVNGWTGETGQQIYEIQMARPWRVALLFSLESGVRSVWFEGGH
jgi:hypothetical protein